MIEIFLIWTLVGGIVQDVDAFKDEHQCLVSLYTAAEMYKRAQDVKPGLGNIQLLGCQSVKIVAPQTPEQIKESM